MSEDQKNGTGEVVMTYARDHHQNRSLAEYRLSWPDFVSWLRRAPVSTATNGQVAKETAPLIKLAQFRGRTRAEADNAQIVAHYGIEGDYDARRVSLEQAVERLERHNVRAVVLPSHRHTEAGPRWRVFAPLSGPTAPELAKRYLARLDAALGGILGEESYDRLRLYYVGTLESIDYRVLPTFGDPEEGYCVDELHDLDVPAGLVLRARGYAADTQSQPKLTRRQTQQRAENCLENLKSGRDFHESLTTLSARYIALGMSEREVHFWFSLLEPLLRRSGRPDALQRTRELYRGELDRLIAGAERKFAADRATATIMHNLRARTTQTATAEGGETQIERSAAAPLTSAQLAAVASVHAAVLDILGPTMGEAAAFLEGLELDSGSMAEYGFRSCAADRWQALGDLLEERFDRESLALSGWWAGAAGEEQYSPPFLGRHPAILAPYYSPRGELEAFRAVEVAASLRSRSIGRDPTTTFGTNGLGALASSSVVHVTGDELSAWLLRSKGWISIAVPPSDWAGAATWPALVRRAGRLVLWFPPDRAGPSQRSCTLAALRSRLGDIWVEETVVEPVLEAGETIFTLAAAGRLEPLSMRVDND